MLFRDGQEPLIILAEPGLDKPARRGHSLTINLDPSNSVVHLSDVAWLAFAIADECDDHYSLSFIKICTRVTNG